LRGAYEDGEEPRLSAENKSNYCKREAWHEFVVHVYEQVQYHQREYLLTVNAFPVTMVYAVELANWFAQRQLTEMKAAETDPVLKSKLMRQSPLLVIPACN